jgi:hypothetical protein
MTFWKALPLCLLLAAPLWADATKADPAKAEKIVKEELEKLKADANLARLIKDEAIEHTFPGHTFFAVIFRQFPIARLAPAPLKSSNLYAVDGEGKVVLINSVDNLKTFFNKGRFGDKEVVRKDVVRAYLRLVQELHQDGFYEFKSENDSLKVDGDKVSGKVMVTKGGNGEISVAITFADGSISAIEGESRLAPGIRPKCQATLLLDANPLVREIVEQDLLVMGRTALPYLAEQHAKASPELKKAIERIRKLILANDR